MRIKLLLIGILIYCGVSVSADSSVGDIYISVVQPERSEIPSEAHFVIHYDSEELFISIL